MLWRPNVSSSEVTGQLKELQQLCKPVYEAGLNFSPENKSW
jgi:hypothetical protein